MSNETTTTVADLKAAIESGDYKRVIALSSGKCEMGAIWASALTAHYGPVGIHKDWTDADGRPTAEAMEKNYRIGDAMKAARDRLPYLVDRLDRFGAC